MLHCFVLIDIFASFMHAYNEPWLSSPYTFPPFLSIPPHWSQSLSKIPGFQFCFRTHLVSARLSVRPLTRSKLYIEACATTSRQTTAGNGFPSLWIYHSKESINEERGALSPSFIGVWLGICGYIKFMNVKAVYFFVQMSFYSLFPYLVFTGAPSLTYKIRKLKLESTYEE